MHDAHMRTTLELDDRLYEVARRRAFEERRSLGDIISTSWLYAASKARTPVVRGESSGGTPD